MMFAALQIGNDTCIFRNLAFTCLFVLLHQLVLYTKGHNQWLLFVHVFKASMSKQQAEDIVHCIVGDIIKECKIRGEIVNEPLAAYIVSAYTR